MDRFAEWLRRRAARQSPTGACLLAGAGLGFSYVDLVPDWIFGHAPTPGKIAVCAAVAAFGTAPLLLARWRARGELRVVARGFAGSVAPLLARLESHAATLEAAARDLEQIEGLGGRGSLGAPETKALVRAADARLARMFELCAAAPARHGLTIPQGEALVADDARWIAEARRLLERTVEAPETVGDDPLGELRAHVAALAELRA